MGTITTGLNPVNKIGTLQTDFKNSLRLNTIQSQGFKLNTNNLSNINPSNKKEVIPLLLGIHQELTQRRKNINGTLRKSRKRNCYTGYCV